MRAVQGGIGLQSEGNAKCVASAPGLGSRVGLLQTFTSKVDFCQGVRWRQLQPEVPTICCPLCGSREAIPRLLEGIQSGIILGVLHVFVTGFFGRLGSRHRERWLLNSWGWGFWVLWGWKWWEGAWRRFFQGPGCIAGMRGCLLTFIHG